MMSATTSGKVGYERLEEIGNPELAAARMGGLYQAKGYNDEWIEKRGVTEIKNLASAFSARRATHNSPEAVVRKHSKHEK